MAGNRLGRSRGSGVKVTDRRLLREKSADRLQRHIEKHGLWGRRLPSQRDLCRQLGISLVTVNRAVRILRQAGLLRSIPKRGTYVVPQPLPGAGVGARCRLIVVSHERQFDPRVPGYTTEIVGPLLAMSVEHNLDVIFTRIEELDDEEAFLKKYAPGATDQIVFVSTFRNLDPIRRIGRLCEGKKVMVDHYVEGAGITGIVDDGVAGVGAMVRHLAELGHRRIAFYGNLYTGINPWKCQGYREGLVGAGLSYDEELVLQERPVEAVAEAWVERLLARSVPPTAFVTADDARALLVVAALERRGLAVGRDVSVGGYGDTAGFGNAAAATLTTVHAEYRQIGELAADYLQGRLPDADGRLLTVPVSLVVRQTTGPAPCG